MLLAPRLRREAAWGLPHDVLPRHVGHDEGCEAAHHVGRPRDCLGHRLTARLRPRVLVCWMDHQLHQPGRRLVERDQRPIRGGSGFAHLEVHHRTCIESSRSPQQAQIGCSTRIHDLPQFQLLLGRWWCGPGRRSLHPSCPLTHAQRCATRMKSVLVSYSCFGACRMARVMVTVRGGSDHDRRPLPQPTMTEKPTTTATCNQTGRQAMTHLVTHRVQCTVGAAARNLPSEC